MHALSLAVWSTLWVYVLVMLWVNSCVPDRHFQIGVVSVEYTFVFSLCCYYMVCSSWIVGTYFNAIWILEEPFEKCFQLEGVYTIRVKSLHLIHFSSFPDDHDVECSWTCSNNSNCMNCKHGNRIFKFHFMFTELCYTLLYISYERIISTIPNHQTFIH